MIYNLDEILKEKLTKDDDCKKTYDNLKGLYATGVVESRHCGCQNIVNIRECNNKEKANDTHN